MNRRFIAICVTVIALLSGNLSAKDYSVAAGNWQVDFKSNETLYTSIDYKAPENSTDIGYYTIWVNKDPGTTPRVSSIFLYDYSPNSAPTSRTWMETYASSLITGFNKTPLMSEYLVDDQKAMIAEGWSDQFEKFTYGAMYPFDPTSDNTAQKFVGYASNLDKETTFAILDSLHVEYTESPQTTQTPITTATNSWVYQEAQQDSVNQDTTPTLESDGNRYSYDFETLGLDFSTPSGYPIVEDDKYTISIGIKLDDSVYMTGEIEEVYSWEDSSSTSSAAESLWDVSYYDDHSPLITSRLDNGDYVVYGRYLSGQSMNTKALRTLDLNNDGQIDYYVVWDGSGKIDQNTITYLAMHSNVRTLNPKWD